MTAHKRRSPLAAGSAQSNVLDLAKRTAPPPPVQRRYEVRVVLSGRKTLFGRYFSLKAAHCEAAKLRGFGWTADVSEAR